METLAPIVTVQAAEMVIGQFDAVVRYAAFNVVLVVIVDI
jgi:hypothetical protein